ncbi:MAG: restriction endonuclease [Bacteroidota bacterium]
MIKQKPITVFEHQSLTIHHGVDGQKLAKHELEALQQYHGRKGLPYFSLIHDGIRLNNHVGVIQVGNTVIEVLPKADHSFSGTDEKKQWRYILIGMLRAVGTFNIYAPTSSDLCLKPNSILDLYFELFIREVEYLLRIGLIRQYRKNEGNVNALKGNLQFGEQIRKNLVHQERFYVCHTVYDSRHLLHFILYKTIRLLRQINTSVSLHNRIGALLLQFPEMPDVKVTETSFSRLRYNRKTEPYKSAIEIARLLLLNYHPDVSHGNNHVLALMFDMNKLWEKFIYVSLFKNKKSPVTIHEQQSTYFWKPEKGRRSAIRADIVINRDREECVVLDAKWKAIQDHNPSSDDLMQMFVYHDYYKSKKVALVYPGKEQVSVRGKYLDPRTWMERNQECCVMTISVESNIQLWQKHISEQIGRWIGN